jgi:hypothetical protein
VHLSDFDLEQLDEARLSELTASPKETLLKNAVADLKEARERLKGLCCVNFLTAQHGHPVQVLQPGAMISLPVARSMIRANSSSIWRRLMPSCEQSGSYRSTSNS